MFVALVIGVVAGLLTKKAYKATVVLDVEQERGRACCEASADERFAFDVQYLPTQIELMKSREIAERVVRKLKLLENRS